MDANERELETRALLEILAIGRNEIENGEHELASDYFARARKERGFS